MKIIIIIILFIIVNCDDKLKRLTTMGDNIGINLYHSHITTQTMKRPQKWFFNVLIHKPNEKQFREAEYNGLRYQTERLKDNLEREYEGYVRDFYEEKLNVHEQKLIATAKLQKRLR